MPRETFTMGNVLATSAREIAQNARRDADEAAARAKRAEAQPQTKAQNTKAKALRTVANTAETRAKAVAKVVEDHGKAAEPAATYDKPQTAMDKHRAAMAAQEAAGGPPLPKTPPKPIERAPSQDRPGSEAIIGGGLLDTSGEAATADTGLLSGAAAARTTTGLPYNRANLPVWSGTGSILGTQKLWDATQTARARAEALSGNYRALDAMWKDAQARRASLAGDPNAQELQSAIMRAAGDQIRIIQGREMGLEGPKPKGLGTPWVGPGLRVALDSEGKVQRDDQGRVVYDYDPEAYRGRFYEKYTPTSAEVEHWRNLFPDSPYDITEGYVTPWQQVNAQWMTGSKNEKGKLLSDLGITPTDEQIGLFDKSLKEGVVPQAWREAWRTEKWGDIWNDQTKMWEPAPPDQREAALQEQQERYEKGYFNPTTGKGGAGEGAVSQWGVGTGLISPKDFVPLDWAGSQPVPSMGITGTPTGIFAPGGVGGAGREFLTTPYTRPALQDWSHLMPEEGLLRSPAQRAIVADQGANFQPWAQGGLIEYSPAGTERYIPPAYVPSTTGTTGTPDTGAGAGQALLDANQHWEQLAASGLDHASYYPGRQEMANIMGGGGLNYFGQGGADFRSDVPSNSADWIRKYGTQGPVFGVDYDATGLLPRATTQPVAPVSNVPSSGLLGAWYPGV